MYVIHCLCNQGVINKLFRNYVMILNNTCISFSIFKFFTRVTFVSIYIVRFGVVKNMGIVSISRVDTSVVIEPEEKSDDV